MKYKVDKSNFTVTLFITNHHKIDYAMIETNFSLNLRPYFQTTTKLPRLCHPGQSSLHPG